MFTNDYLNQVCGYNTAKDHRGHNSKVSRLLSALAIELKDLPLDQQKRIDYIINDLRDGYKFNWFGAVEFNKTFVKN